MAYFIRYQNGEAVIINSATVNFDDDPCWLIPGIHGRGPELLTLAHELDVARGGNTPIFIANEAALKDTSLLNLTLNQLAQKMYEEINDITRGQIENIQLVGYSSGAILAGLLSNILAANGFIPRLVAIDQPDMSSVEEYINQGGESLMQDLVNVVKVAALYAGITETDIVFTDSEIKQASIFMNLEDRISTLAHATLTKFPAPSSDDKQKFFEYLARAHRNLTFPEEASPTKTINSTHLIITKPTAIKYGAKEDEWQQFTGGWDKRSEELEVLTSATLANQGHLDLLKGKCAKEIAELTSNAFHKDLRADIDNIYNAKLEALQKSYAEARKTKTRRINPEPQNSPVPASLANSSATIFTPFNNPSERVKNIAALNKHDNQAATTDTAALKI